MNGSVWVKFILLALGVSIFMTFLIPSVSAGHLTVPEDWANKFFTASSVSISGLLLGWGIGGLICEDPQ